MGNHCSYCGDIVDSEMGIMEYDSLPYCCLCYDFVTTSRVRFKIIPPGIRLREREAQQEGEK